jgi:hypothetical protein
MRAAKEGLLEFQQDRPSLRRAGAAAAQNDEELTQRRRMDSGAIAPDPGHA